MDNYKKLATDEVIQKTVGNLKNANINAITVEDENQAIEKIHELLPKGSEVMNMTSITLTQLGLDKEILESGNYNPVRAKLLKLDRATQSLEMQKLGAAPEYAIGSVHAVTEDGKVLIASNTGSQMSAYVYGALHVIWVVGTQKIVNDIEEGKKRIYEYILPLESERLNKQYNTDRGSFVSKLLIVTKEVKPGRITIIFVKKLLGF